MKSKSSPNRSVEADIVRLHHATGRQRDELIAKLLYEMLEDKGKKNQARKN